MTVPGNPPPGRTRDFPGTGDVTLPGQISLFMGIDRFPVIRSLLAYGPCAPDTEISLRRRFRTCPIFRRVRFPGSFNSFPPSDKLTPVFSLEVQDLFSFFYLGVESGYG